ncbi:hypothetical protein ACVWYU_001718 [Pseudomonas sp. TE12234]
MNGWQRLWVVASIGFGLFIIFITYENLPTKESLKRNHNFQTEVDKAELNFAEHPDKNRNSFGGIIFSNRTVEQIKEAIASEDADYDIKLKTLTETQAKKFGIAGLIWVGLSLLAYLAGYSIYWVYRGFRPKKT